MLRMWFSREEIRMRTLRNGILFSVITLSLTSELVAQMANPVPATPRSGPLPEEAPIGIPPPAAGVPAVIPATPRSAPMAPASQRMDKANRDRLLRLLAREGKKES